MAVWGEPDMMPPAPDRMPLAAEGMRSAADQRRLAADGMPPVPDARERKGIVVGIGNELRADDAAGMEVARLLAHRSAVPVILAGDVPENYVGVVRSRSPDWILLIDAVDFGSTPGATLILRMNGAQPAFAPTQIPSTHCASLSLFARYLGAETGAEVWLLGIQPKSLELGCPMSVEVAGAVEPAVCLAETWAERRSAAMEV